METIISSPSSFTPHFAIPKPNYIKSFNPKNQRVITSSLQESSQKSVLTYIKHGLAATALSLAINFAPIYHLNSAFASEFDIINEGPPTETFVVDDAGVLSRVTKSDLKRLVSDLKARKNLEIDFITVRKLTSKADAFEYADQVLEKWYPTVEQGSNKGLVVLVTSQKEGAITGGPEFVKAVGDTILDATISENLPVLATEEKYNEAMISTAKRLVAAIDGLPDPGGPKFKENKRESNFKSKEETDEKRGQFTLVVGENQTIIKHWKLSNEPGHLICNPNKYVPGSGSEANILVVLESMRIATASAPEYSYAIKLNSPSVFGNSGCMFDISTQDCISCMDESVNYIKSMCPQALSVHKLEVNCSVFYGFQ